MDPEWKINFKKGEGGGGFQRIVTSSSRGDYGNSCDISMNKHGDMFIIYLHLVIYNVWEKMLPLWE